MIFGCEVTLKLDHGRDRLRGFRQATLAYQRQSEPGGELIQLPEILYRAVTHDLAELQAFAGRVLRGHVIAAPKLHPGHDQGGAIHDTGLLQLFV